MRAMSPRLLMPLLAGALLAPALATAAIPPELQQKFETLTKESDAIAKQRTRWEGVQAALLKQKQEIEANQKAVMAQQDALNQRSAAHNQEAAAQAQRIKSGKQGCSNDDSSQGGSGDDRTNGCNTNAKTVNQKTGDLNAETEAMKAQQDDLESKYAKANQDASDWQAHESQATDHLNQVYHSMNDWLDRAYPVITDSDFRDEVTARNADVYCENRGLPAGTLSIPTLKRLNDGYRKCLKYVLDAQHKAAAAGAPPAP
jgi:hypothetical protein